MTDRDQGQIVEYAPRSKGELAKLRKQLNLDKPPAGVGLAQPASGAIWSHVETRLHRGKARTTTLQLTDGALLAGLGVLFIYELDKGISAWAESIGADLQGINPLNWLSSGMNAAQAAVNVRAAQQAAQEAAQNPPVAKAPSSGGSSNVPQVVQDKLHTNAWNDFWSSAWEALAHHRLEIPPAA